MLGACLAASGVAARAIDAIASVLSAVAAVAPASTARRVNRVIAFFSLSRPLFDAVFFEGLLGNDMVAPMAGVENAPPGISSKFHRALPSHRAWQLFRSPSQQDKA